MSDYANMTAAELREVTQPLKGSGLWWPCAFDAVEQRWRKSSCGTPITVPEAAAMLERACADWLSENRQDWTQAPNGDGSTTVTVRYGLGKQRTVVTGPTPLHALVKAVEAVGKASEPKLDAFTRRQVQSFADDVAYVMGGTKPVPPPANDEETDLMSYSLFNGETEARLSHHSGNDRAWLTSRELATNKEVSFQVTAKSLRTLRKAIDAAIERIGGGQ